MKVRRKIINECAGQPRLQKALAFALLLKQRLGRSAMLCDYSTNKIHNVTKLSPTTIKKYMPIIVQQGWVSFTGDKQQHLVMRKIASHCDARNIIADKLCFDSFKDVYNSIRAFLMMLIQSKKDFIKRTILTAANPKRKDDYKKVRKQVKRLVRNGVLGGLYEAYREYGLSLQRIARQIGVCIRTTQRVVKYAIQQNWVSKHNHYEKVDAPNVNYYQVDGYTYTTKNALYVVHANTYTLSDGIQASLGMVL